MANTEKYGTGVMVSKSERAQVAKFKSAGS